MSSNPFRRARNPVEPDASSANIFDHTAPTRPAPEGAAPPTPKRTKKKRVVIVSPPHSPETLYSHHVSASDSATRASAPPPHIDPRSGEESESESTSTADDSDLEPAAVSNAGKNAAPVSRPEVTSGAMRAPYNPFATTLASNEVGLGLQNTQADQGHGPRENKEQRKPAMDVDMFKNILMTGGPVPAGLSNTGAQVRQHDSSSNTTDTSSVFDPAYGLHPESPTMAYDDYHSASDDGSDSDHEQSQLMGLGRSDDIEPTVPPKPKRAVQTVSFADFDNTIPPGFQSAGPPAHIAHVTGILRTSTPPRSNSHLNKPLPKPPQETAEPSPPVVPAKDTPSPQPQTAVVAPPPANDEATPKKVPPPPPRRQAHGRARSVSNVSNITQDSAASVPGSEASSLQQKPEDSTPKPAPPPPPRRHMAQPAISTPPRPSSPQQSDKKLAPVVPPARRSANASRRTSDDLTTASRIHTPPTASGGAAPPVPPSRRERGSKRRLSGEHYRGASFDSERSASISSLQQVREMGEFSEQAVTSPDVSQRNILDDMAAFQAEIEALARAEETQAR